MISRILICLFLAGLCFPAFAEPEAGKPPPALIVQEVDGNHFDLSQQRGKVVIVHFFATWCPDCREEMPALDAFYRHNSSKRIAVIALSIDKPHELEKVKAIMQPFAYKAAMVGDARVNDFGIPDALPVTYIIDEKGVVRKKMIPEAKPLAEQDFEGAVFPLLEER
jgi:peroxiredoxin